jgi:glycine/D-amino acid oxidase-like deaminating enzyme
VTKRLYDENLYQFGSPQESYWEASATDVDVSAPPLSTSETCDVAIIGGGYTGLSAALHLARDYSTDVRVLEAGHIGWGASGRNGGFCSMGGTGVHRHELVKMVGMDNTRDFYRSQIEGIELVRDLADSEGIDYQAVGDAELEVAHVPKAFTRLQKDYDLLTKELGIEARLFTTDECRERFYDSSEQFGALQIRPTFGLHPLRYCRGLANAAIRRGAKLHARSEVTSWQKTDDGMHKLTTAGGTLSARKVIYCTNGFMPEKLRPEFYGRTLPVISAIIVTRPLSEEELAAHSWLTKDPAINSRRVLNYFRLLPDNRFLFGGRGHTTGHVEGEAETYRRLEAMLKKLWPAWSAVNIDYAWHGLICMTRKLYPAIGQLDDDQSVFYGYGYHGNGVNTATWTGKQLADCIGSGSSPDLPDIVHGTGGRFPLAPLRLKYLRAGIALSSWLDRRG